MPIDAIMPPMSALGRVTGPLPASGSPAAGSVQRAVAEEFEAFVLQNFIEAALPRDAESVFGRGTSGTFWKSMMAEQLARELSRSGGVGIADLIAAGSRDRSRTEE